MIRVTMKGRKTSCTHSVQGQDFLITGTERGTQMHRVLIDSVLQIQL